MTLSACITNCNQDYGTLFAFVQYYRLVEFSPLVKISVCDKGV